jgi:hypothetical protein
MVECAEVGLLTACASLMPCAADSSGTSKAVDIFNVASGAWSTAALSVARMRFAATSLPNVGVAIFAGGTSTCCHVYFCIFAGCVVLVGETNFGSLRFLLRGLGNRMLVWAEVDSSDCACKSHVLRS